MDKGYKPLGIRVGKEKKRGLRVLTQTAILLAIVLAVQSLRLPSYFTGPVVNAVLILAALFSGTLSGVTIGCITPIVALLMGIIPPVAAPLVPLIVVANITLVLIFVAVDRINRYLAWLAAAFGKFAVFYLGLNYLLGVFEITLPGPLIIAFQLPQLYTALVGGLLAVIMARYLKNVL